MLDATAIPPPRRSELLIKPIASNGKCVVKDPYTRQYFHLGEQEAFLLRHLDGKQSCQAICAAFGQQFTESLSPNELVEFVELARRNGFLQPKPIEGQPKQIPSVDLANHRPSPTIGTASQSILYWRRRVFDPDRLFNWLTPKLWFIWTRTFLIASALGIVAAGLIAWSNGRELVTLFAYHLRWETVVLCWLTLFSVTTCHEFAHGLTCKRHGGEVHEIGFLLMFFMPCFYCNVSDAWLFPEKSKRLWVTLAGAYCDLCLWTLAVFVWRLTPQDHQLNYLSWVVLSVTGARVFFNFNPFIKLDGYYLLSDMLEMPNLRARAISYLLARFRWLLWGAPRPTSESRGRILLSYGLLSWLFSLTLVSLLVIAMASFLHSHIGFLGSGFVLILGLTAGHGLLKDLFAGEFTKMILQRPKRRTWWLILILIVVSGAFVPVTDRAKGTCLLRPVTRAELRAPTAGFLNLVYFDEGQKVKESDVVAQLEIPDLESRTAQVAAELSEAEAQLRLLQANPLRTKLTHGQSMVKESRVREEAISAAAAHFNQVQEKLSYLQQLKQRLPIASPISGCIVTPRMKEKTGHYFQEGDLVCEIEQLSTLEAEVSIRERDAARLRPGQSVSIKVQALPFEVFKSRVERIAPRATSGDLQSTVTIYCKLEATTEQVRPGMTGYARIDCDRVAVGVLLLRRAFRLIRTEFWW